MSGALTDGLGRRHTHLRISLTERCNLRCVYCMPAEGVPLVPRPDRLTAAEIERLGRYFVSRGVAKVRLTGGEPLARRDAPEIAARLGAIPGLGALALTTNGLLLSRHLGALAAAGLTHLTLSLDTLRPDRFRALTRRDGLEAVLDALHAALAAGYGHDPARPLKLNCVVLRGQNDDEAGAFAALARAHPVEVRFIEFMPFAGNAWGRDALVPWAETRAAVEAAHGPLVPRTDAPSATARTFAFAAGGAGRVGFVASMTAPFCAGCTRLRVTADGALKVCLFGRAEVSLRDALRAGASDADLDALVSGALARKAPAHAGHRLGLDALAAEADGNRSMTAIGG